jgi:very-short-patch-repair endonuclease
MAAAPAGSEVTGVSAFGVQGLPLPDGFAQDAANHVHLLAPAGARHSPRRPGIVGHARAPHCQPVTHPRLGVRLTALTHAWVDAVRRSGLESKWAPWDQRLIPLRGRFDTAPKRAFLEAVQLGDVLMRRQEPWCWPEQLGDCAATARGAGSKLVREAFKQVRARTDSFMETWLRLVVWDAGFPDPVVNLEVSVDRRTYLLDLAWPDQRIDLEYHGRQHFSESTQSYKDVSKRSRLQDAGWTVHEAVYADLVNPADLLLRLARSFARRPR